MRGVATSVADGWRVRWAIVRLLPAGGPVLPALSVGAAAVAGLLPLAFVAATSVLVGEVPPAAGHGWHTPAAHRLIGAFVAATVAFVALQALAAIRPGLDELLARRVDARVRDRLAAASVDGPSVAALEDPALLAQVAEAANVLEYDPNTPGRAVSGLVALVVRYVPALGAAVVVAIVFSPWAALLLAVGAGALRHGMRGSIRQWAGVRTETLQHVRESWYFRWLGLAPEGGKELRVFGLLDWVQRRYRGALDAAWAVEWPARRRLLGRRVLRQSALAYACYAAATVWAAHAAATHSLSLRDLTFVLQAGGMIVAAGSFFEDSDWQTEFGMRAFRALVGFERGAAEVQARVPAGTRDPAGLPRSAIRFDGVSFAYPGSERRVLDGLDLELEVGRSLAVVGLNGAGKTTLVKLLARLYEPTAGRILADGVDVRELRSDAWQRTVAAIFQDFIRYELPLRENVALGHAERLDDDAAFAAVSRRARLDEVTAGLAGGAATILSARYAGGTDLSGGQWQRVALARALFAVECGARVLVLDEPTANLDVRAEVDFFDRFLELTRGLTTIVVSHRFSTVRRADRIVVLEHGRVVEDGDHDELLAAGGRYAQLFRLQAARFAAGDELLAAEDWEEA